MAHFYSPLRYPGGKNCIFPFMSTLIRDNGLEGCSYAEPFAGGAGLALHLLLEGIVSEIYLNDLDYSIYCLWNSILNETTNFCKWIKSINVNMETWHWAKSIHSNLKTHSVFEIGTATFYLNRTNVSGIITGGPIGGPKQIGKFKIDARFNKEDLIERIQAIAKFKKKIHLFNLDGNEFLKIINRKHRNVLIYIDPPYVNKGADLYMNYFAESDHRTLFNTITKLKKNWVVSYDNTDLIVKLYEIYIRVSYALSQCTSNRMGDEILIFPNSIRTENALKKLKSAFVIASRPEKS